MDVWWITVTFLALYSGKCIGQLTLQPEGKERAFFTNELIGFTCLAGGSDIQDLEWSGPSGDAITNTEGRVRVEPGTSVTSESINMKSILLVIEKIKLEDEGQYQCSAALDGRQESIKLELIVYDSINFEDTETDQYAPEGSNITMTCSVHGQPQPVVSWSSIEKSLSKNAKYSISGNQLTVYNVAREDAGNYTCSARIVTALSSQFKSVNITLHVQYVPAWSEKFTEIGYSSINHTTNLTCEAKGEPSPTFEWKKDDEVIHPSSTYTIYNEQDKTALQITVHNSSAFGEYKCRASNIIGSIERSIYLEKGDTPDPPTITVTSDEAGTLTVDISPPTGNELDILGYKLEYKLTTDSWSNARIIELNIGHQHIIRELNDDTEYIIRVAARNEVGHGAYSQQVTKRTKTSHSGKDVNDSSPLSSQLSALAVLLSTSVSLWVLRL